MPTATLAGPETQDQAQNETDTSSILIGPLEFKGPSNTLSAFEPLPGLLAVLVEQPHGYELVHIYQTANIKSSATLELSDNFLEDHNVALAAYYTAHLDAMQRHSLATLVWREFDEEDDLLDA